MQLQKRAIRVSNYAMSKMLMTAAACACSLLFVSWLSSFALAVEDESASRRDDGRGDHRRDDDRGDDDRDRRGDHDSRDRAPETWIGSLDFGGTSRVFAIQIEERKNHQLIGYVLGGTGSRTIVEGRRRGSETTFSLELRDPVRTKLMTISGHVRGDALIGIADDGATTQSVMFRRTNRVLHERRFLVVEENTSIVQLSVVLDSSGAFVSGGFVGEQGCVTWACSGGLTSFAEAGTTLTIGLETDGGCSAGTGSALHATFDPGAKLYSGDYSFTDCGGTNTGSVFMARTTRTRSDDIAQVLEALGQLADDFEDRADFRTSHDSFSRGYLHYGRTLRNTLAGYNEERDRFSSIDATFNRIQLIHTVDDPDVFPLVRQPLGAYFDEIRKGRTSRDSVPVTYLDTHANPGDRTLRFWSKEGSRWVIRGNQTAAFDLPFEYTLGTTTLITPTPGGPVYVALGAYGAHFNPVTGHLGGDLKGNLVGFFTQSTADLTELEGDGDGLCETAELCGFFGGADGHLIRSRVPTYTAPISAKINSVTFRAPNGTYFDNVPKWVVEMELYPGRFLRLDHIGWIAPGLRSKILLATGGLVDTDTYAGPEGEIAGVAGIPLAAGEVLAFPQILADPIPGHPGYFGGGGTFPDRPWAEMQFSFDEILPGVVERVCFFDHLPPALKGTLQSIFDADAADPQSQLFSGFPMKWQWASEMRLCRAYSPLPEDFSSLNGNFGGWASLDGAEMVAFVEIEKDNPTYDPALYSSPDVSTLITRVHPLGSTTPFTFSMIGGVIHANYPVGEIVELTADTLLIKWRTANTADDITFYERAKYILDENGLKMRWGPAALTVGGLPPIAPLTAATPCTTFNVVCYDRVDRDGF